MDGAFGTAALEKEDPIVDAITPWRPNPHDLPPVVRTCIERMFGDDEPGVVRRMQRKRADDQLDRRLYPFELSRMVLDLGVSLKLQRKEIIRQIGPRASSSSAFDNARFALGLRTETTRAAPIFHPRGPWPVRSIVAKAPCAQRCGQDIGDILNRPAHHAVDRDRRFSPGREVICGFEEPLRIAAKR